jgi:DNA-binding GntR family transcriptional regulator
MEEDANILSPQQKSLENVQSIVRALEVDIVLGRLYPRERLVEEQLAKRFDTTRHVIRQVLIELERAGLLVHEANKGATVCEYTAEEVNQLYQMREIVERQAAMLISLPIDPEEYEKIKLICDEHAAAVDKSDMQRIVAANKEFHQATFRLCGNIFLADVIDEMAKKANLVRFTSSTNLECLAQARDEHYQILNTLKGKDHDALADICVRHLQPSRRMYLEKRAHLS